MKSKDSITADEKKLLEYLYQKACDIADYCHRNNMLLPVSINVYPDYVGATTTYDYREVNFYQNHPSGRTSRIVSLGYNHCTGKADYHEALYEDKGDE